jgi:hypothetical protein
VYHELNARKVQPAGGDVGGDEDVALTRAEGRDGGVPGHLGEVAVKRGDGSAPNRALVLAILRPVAPVTMDGCKFNSAVNSLTS